MDEKYKKFVNEVDFSRQLLGIGLTSLRKADFSTRGLYFQALSSISLGLERLLKLCLILDDYNKTGQYPSRKVLKDYGHKLTELFNFAQKKTKNAPKLNEIQSNALELLTKFATSSRYSNIDFITNDFENDPIKEWYTEIDEKIWSVMLKPKDINRIIKKCEEVRSLVKDLPIFVGGYEDEMGNEIKDAGELYYLNTRSSLLAGYRVLVVIYIIKAILKILQTKIDETHNNDFRMLELGRIFSTITYGTDKEKIRRKNFIKR